MGRNCEDNSEQLRIFWIMVESIIVLFYWSIQIFSKDKIKISVYSKMARNYITRRKVYSLSYFYNIVWLWKLFKWITRPTQEILPIEAGVRSHVLRDMRICQFCEADIGDEFH